MREIVRVCWWEIEIESHSMFQMEVRKGVEYRLRIQGCQCRQGTLQAEHAPCHKLAPTRLTPLDLCGFRTKIQVTDEDEASSRGKRPVSQSI
jgi:hypothetical protein